MRLIDADKLLEPGYTDMFDVPIRFAMVSRNAIETAPTVKAITIEWLHSIMEKQIIFAMNSDGNIYFISAAIARQVLANVIELWEKENEESLAK